LIQILPKALVEGYREGLERRRPACRDCRCLWRKPTFPSDSFDAVYVRQGLHHAADLPRMLEEIARVIRPGGVLLACREHVVDNYEESLQAFLDSQVDHQLYGGEHAFTLQDYRSAIAASGLIMLNEMGPLIQSSICSPIRQRDCMNKYCSRAPEGSCDILCAIKKSSKSVFGGHVAVLLPDDCIPFWQSRVPHRCLAA